MASNRIYINATIYGARITGLRNLWEPSTEYQGKRVEKPNYITGVIVPKTQAQWWNEPILAGFAASCSELFQRVLAPMGITFEQTTWPVKDGDLPPGPGKQPIDWCRGHWFISGSSTQPINVDIVQAGQSVKLHNRAGVKAGDYVVLSGVVVQKTNDPRGVKLYANNVLFVGPGEEIAIGNSVSGAELMEQAKAKGMAITGFGPAHAAGGFPGQSFGQSGGFAAPGAAQPGFGGPAPGGGFPGQPAQQPAPAYAPPPAGYPQAGPAPGQPYAPPPMQPPAGGFPGQPAQYQPQPGGPAPGGFPGQPQQGGYAPPPSGFAPPR